MRGEGKSLRDLYLWAPPQAGWIANFYVSRARFSQNFCSGEAFLVTFCAHKK